MKHKYRILCIFSTFGRDFKLTAPTLIGEDVIVTLDSESGKPLHSFGKDMFLMPHGLTIDNEGNHYVTDVGLHQVLRVTICQMSVDSLFMPAPYFFFPVPAKCNKTGFGAWSPNGAWKRPNSFLYANFSRGGRKRPFLCGGWLL